MYYSLVVRAFSNLLFILQYLVLYNSDLVKPRSLRPRTRERLTQELKLESSGTTSSFAIAYTKTC